MHNELNFGKLHIILRDVMFYDRLSLTEWKYIKVLRHNDIIVPVSQDRNNIMILFRDKVGWIEFISPYDKEVNLKEIISNR